MAIMKKICEYQKLICKGQNLFCKPEFQNSKINIETTIFLFVYINGIGLIQWQLTTYMFMFCIYIKLNPADIYTLVAYISKPSIGFLTFCKFFMLTCVYISVVLLL